MRRLDREKEKRIPHAGVIWVCLRIRKKEYRGREGGKEGGCTDVRRWGRNQSSKGVSVLD